MSTNNYGINDILGAADDQHEDKQPAHLGGDCCCDLCNDDCLCRNFGCLIGDDHADR